MVFVDTSAFYALMVAEDRCHGQARTTLTRLEADHATLLSSSFVVQETVTLLQARHGVAAVRRFRAAVQPLIEVVWVDSALYERAIAALLASGSRRISLTGWSSFEIMRLRGLDEAFAFDRHFEEQGFTVVPAPA